jgi:hypothetical protein
MMLPRAGRRRKNSRALIVLSERQLQRGRRELQNRIDPNRKNSGDNPIVYGVLKGPPTMATVIFRNLSSAGMSNGLVVGEKCSPVTLCCKVT